MRTYSKPALTIEQQIALLESRGLPIPDHERAVRHLSNIPVAILAMRLAEKVLKKTASELG